MKPAILLCALSLAAPAQELRWLTLPGADVEIDGLPWYAENEGELLRLPLRLKDTFPAPVWNLAKSPSGARLRLRTNSPVLAIRLEYPSAANMTNMHAFGQTGVDLYADDVYLSTAIGDAGAQPGKIYERRLFERKDGPAGQRDLTLYLPLYKPVKVLGIGIAKDAAVGKPRPFALPKPLVFYGTSITQGGCASRSGMSYQAILGRMLNLDFVNLGFSGNGRGEPAASAAVAEIDAAMFVLDFSQNNRTLESLKEVYDGFIETIRTKHSETPILAITPIYAAREAWVRSNLEAMREHIRQVVSRRIAAGDRRLSLIEGTDLLGPSRVDGLVDGTHPNDLGFQWMAEGIAARLRHGTLGLAPAP